MSSNKLSSQHQFGRFGKSMFFVAIISLFIHCIVLLSEMYLFGINTSGMHPGRGILYIFFRHLISIKMIPTFVSYSVLVSMAYYLYLKTKKTIEVLNKNELKNEKMKTMLHTSQVTSGILINQIQGYNAQLKEWIMERESNGGKSPEKIIQINRCIEKSLSVISKKFFLDPYVGQNIIDDKSSELDGSEMLVFSQKLQSCLSEVDED